MVTRAVVLISGRTAVRPATDRMNGHGPIEDGPAALAPVANRPLLLHVLDSLERYGIDDVLLAIDADLAAPVREIMAGIDRRGLRVSLFAPEQLTLAAALWEVQRLRGPTPVLVHFADSLSRGLERHLEDAAPKEHDALLLVEERDEPGGAVLSLNGHNASLPGLGPVGAGWSPAGVAVFGSGAGTAARSLGGGANHDLELVALAQELASGRGKLETRSVDEWLRLRQPGGLLEANRYALEGLGRDVPAKTLGNGSDAQGSVAIDTSAQLESSVVRGPAVIGARARLTDAYVGPYSSIGDDVVIDGAEVEHSIILSGSRVCHLGGRIEGSVIGPNARVFRDFRLPNALRLHVGEGAVVSVH
jgi:glucose-1-phosphate thymidylyltransferase